MSSLARWVVAATARPAHGSNPGTTVPTSRGRETDIELPVLQVVCKDVDERVADLALRPDVATVVPIGPDAAPPSAEDLTVHAYGDTNGEAAHAVVSVSLFSASIMRCT